MARGKCRLGLSGSLEDGVGDGAMGVYRVGIIVQAQSVARVVPWMERAQEGVRELRLYESFGRIFLSGTTALLARQRSSPWLTSQHRLTGADNQMDLLRRCPALSKPRIPALCSLACATVPWVGRGLDNCPSAIGCRPRDPISAGLCDVEGWQWQSREPRYHFPARFKSSETVGGTSDARSPTSQTFQKPDRTGSSRSSRQ
jgi:hypothetical protein